MKKGVYIISIAAIGVVLFGEQLAGFAKIGLASLKEADIFQKETQEEIKGEVVLEINYGSGSAQISSGNFVEGMTAQSLLEEKIMEFKSKLTIISNSATGSFVKAIGDKENGQDGKYWLYYVNGQMPMVSVDKTKLKPGDKVEFKFEKSSF